jgi:5-formyltetrahydrofolate cyclo-ligase
VAEPFPPRFPFADKLAARKPLLQQRQRLSESTVQQTSQAMVAHAKNWPGWDAGTAKGDRPAVVAGFWPLAGEPDLIPLLEWLAARGHPICLPCVLAPDQPLVFRSWYVGDPLQPSAVGKGALLEPLPQAMPLRPNLLLVPALAIDARGNRLGFGAGYYDRSLAALTGEAVSDGRPPITAVGVAFQAFWYDSLLIEPHDQPLQAGLHEGGWVDF